MFQNFLDFEGMTIVSDDGLRDTIPINNIVEDKLRNLFVCNVCHKNVFNPFSEIFGNGDDEFIAILGCRIDQVPMRLRPH